MTWSGRTRPFVDLGYGDSLWLGVEAPFFLQCGGAFLPLFLTLAPSDTPKTRCVGSTCERVPDVGVVPDVALDGRHE